MKIVKLGLWRQKTRTQGRSLGGSNCMYNCCAFIRHSQGENISGYPSGPKKVGKEVERFWSGIVKAKITHMIFETNCILHVK